MGRPINRPSGYPTRAAMGVSKVGGKIRSAPQMGRVAT